MGYISELMKSKNDSVPVSETLRNLVVVEQRRLVLKYRAWSGYWQRVIAYGVLNYLMKKDKNGVILHPTLNLDKINSLFEDHQKKCVDVLIEANIISSVNTTDVELDNNLIRLVLEQTDVLQQIKSKGLLAAAKLNIKSLIENDFVKE